MDDSLDWAPLIRRLRAGWWLVALAAIGGAAVSLALDAFKTNRFQAEAVLAVARPAAPVELDARFESPDPNPEFPYYVSSLRAYPELVLADGIAQAVLEALRAKAADGADGGPAMGFGDFNDLRALVEVEAKAEGGLISIRARASSPEAAAAIANTWAEVFSARMAAVLGPAERLDAVAAALADAADALATAEAAEDRAATGVIGDAEATSVASGDAGDEVQAGAGARLERARRRAEERYLAIAREADELAITRDTARPEVRVASPAVPSSRLPWSAMLQRALAAAALGAVAGALSALGRGARPPD